MAGRAKMLVHADWPAYGSELIDTDADHEMNWVISLIEEIRSVRMQMHVPAGAKILMLSTGMDAAATSAWQRNEILIKRLARIAQLDDVASFPKGCATVASAGASFGLPLAGSSTSQKKKRACKSLSTNWQKSSVGCADG